VACRATDGKRTLVRVVRLPEASGGGVVIDPTGKQSGRGAYVCQSEECVALALKRKAFERSLKVPPLSEEVAAQLKAAV
jgi:uncharacterized protein